MPVDLYYVPLSAPCRTAMMAAYLAGVDVNLKLVNLMAGEQMRPEFLKINPEHTVPTIDDDGFYLHESHAICGYLVGQYAKNDSLYPEEPEKRAAVDQKLFFNASTLYPSFVNIYIPIARGLVNKLDQNLVQKLHDALAFLETMLSTSDYAAGSHLTVADLALVSTASSIDAVDATILEAYPHVSGWFKRCQKEIDRYDELNGKGAQLYGQWIKGALAKLKA